MPPGKLLTMTMIFANYGTIGPSATEPDGFHFRIVTNTLGFNGGGSLGIYYGTPANPTARLLNSVSLTKTL